MKPKIIHYFRPNKTANINKIFMWAIDITHKSYAVENGHLVIKTHPLMPDLSEWDEFYPSDLERALIEYLEMEQSKKNESLKNGTK